MAHATWVAALLMSSVLSQSIVAEKSQVCAIFDPFTFFYDSTRYQCERCPDNQINNPDSNI